MTLTPNRRARTRLLSAAAVLGAGLLAAGVALAQAPEGRPFAPHFGPGPMLLQHLDTDGDGVITREEAEAAWRAWFQDADADGDGTVTREEMRAFMEARSADRLRVMFDRIDTDGDGMISFAEAEAAFQAHMGARFEGRGPDRPGGREGHGLTEADIEAHFDRMFDRLDADGDGVITAEELSEMRMGRPGRPGRGGWGPHGEHGHPPAPRAE